MKRISMAGADIAVTDERIAAVLLEYAKHLGRVGTTDTVTLPVAANGRGSEASLLLGPASQIAVTDNNDVSLEHIELPGVDAFVADVNGRIALLRGQEGGPKPGAGADEATDPVAHHEPGDPRAAFVDFGEYDGQSD